MTASEDDAAIQVALELMWGDWYVIRKAGQLWEAWAKHTVGRTLTASSPIDLHDMMDIDFAVWSLMNQREGFWPRPEDVGRAMAMLVRSWQR